jgi:hypothetical protein
VLSTDVAEFAVDLSRGDPIIRSALDVGAIENLFSAN